ncbi:hypothetical protein VOLCADRAFT_99961 [Volvox carteri f. nagariensis]|uniref:Uncharacterized protein n=1 Tax=Volvox carteri f. nagariensis TaxID=3068 RepID=D8UJ32_VOLCA|nr:uncharacterized protein VOLCADRAFT_99961 [Volvox carteri f. nagariensis]EFJ40278.1 hypothetical protein VOLCADRAFT_99961 [Volvox carteri f. nagariensis]|eukprot:XP_002958675.1 hypothetical protein VOLCADRAFT_99961 [Volvox carteri f. nagariensis]
MNKTEELCGRLPKLLDHEWAEATAHRIQDCVSQPVLLTSPTHTTSIHILMVKHDDCYNPALVAAVWDRVQPDAVALDVQPQYPKSFTRMAKAMYPGLMDKLLSTPLTSLSGALDHADDFDRLRWHHALLQVVGQGASPILISQAALFNVFANRDLHLTEAIAVAHLAVQGPAAGADAIMLQALGEDDFWTDEDSAAYRRTLLQVADPKLRSAVSTWLQRFVLSRLEQALSRQQLEESFVSAAAGRVAHEAHCIAHSEPRVREHLRLQGLQTAHHLARLRDIASGRLGGRRCNRILAVMSAEHALRLRRLAEAPGEAVGPALVGGTG